MASGTLRISSNFGNPYEEARERLKFNPFFVAEDWRNVAKGNSFADLDMYIHILNNTDKLSNLSKLNKDYSYDFSDTDTRIGVLYNEIFEDRNTLKEFERYKKDENGQILLDNNNNPILEKYNTTAYEHYKSLLKERNDVRYSEFVREQEKELYDSMSGFSKFWANTAAVGLNLVSGVTRTIDGFTSILGGLAEAGKAIFTDEKMSDAFVEAVVSEDYRNFTNFQDWVVEFERKYTNFRNIDGEYTTLGKWVGGTLTTVGELIPAIVAISLTKGAATPLIAKSGLLSSSALIGATTTSAAQLAATKVASVAASSMYYGAMTSNSIRDAYLQMSKYDLSPSNSQIISNAGIKTALEISIEVLLGRILGTTGLDAIRTGKNISSSVKSTSLVKTAFGNILKDMGQEGLEEVLQEISGFLTDRVYMSLVNENFGKISELTFENLLMSFAIGSIVSFGSSAFNVMLQDSTGKGIKGKLETYSRNLTLQSFAENYNKLISYSKNEDLSNKERVKVEKALSNMYASYRMLSSIYNEVGSERFAAALKIIEQIDANVKEGKYDIYQTRYKAKEVYDSLYDADFIYRTKKNAERDLEKIKKKLEKVKKKSNEEDKKNVDKIKQAGITSLTEKAIHTDDDVSDEVNQDSLIEELKKVRKATNNKFNIFIAKDGNNVVVIGKDVLVPRNLLESGGSEVITATLAEQEIIEQIKEGKISKHKIALDSVLNTYIEFTGIKDATMDEALLSLLFDKNAGLYKVMLAVGNKDAYSLLEGIAQLIQDESVNDLQQAEFKNKLKIIFTNMRQALVQHLKIQTKAEYNLDILTPQQINDIRKSRITNEIYNKVILGSELSDNEKLVLRNRINYMNTDSSHKGTLLKNIESSDAKTRARTMAIIDDYYNNTFTNKYDGITYLPETSIANMSFNAFLQNLRLDLKTIFNKSFLTESDISLMAQEIGKDDIVAYRKWQYLKYTNDFYTFSVSNKGMFTVSEVKTSKRKGFSLFNKSVESIISSNDLYNNKKHVPRTILDSASKLNNIVQSLISEDVPKYSARMASIDDLIKEPTLLKKNLYNIIEDSYGRVTPEVTFAFLRNYVTQKNPELSIVAKPSGSYAFVSVTESTNVLKNKNIKITEDTKITDLIKDKYLKGNLSDLKIVLTDDNIRAEYRPYKLVVTSNSNAKLKVYDNTIYINRKIAEEGGAELQFVFLHEFQHALNFENQMNMGMDCNWIKGIDSKLKSEIISDVRKHMSHLFKIGASDEEIEKIVSRFVYYSTGETDAYGVYTSEFNDYYPTLVNYTKDGTKVSFPWGSSYLLTSDNLRNNYNASIQEICKGLYEVENFEELLDGLDVDDRVIDYKFNLNSTVGVWEILPVTKYPDSKYNEINAKVEKWTRLPMNTPVHESELFKESLSNLLTTDIGLEYKNLTLKQMQKIIAPTVSMQEFMNMDIPFIRFQKYDELRDSPYISITAGAKSLASIVTAFKTFYNISSHPWDIKETNLIVGTFKPKDCLCYIPSNESEALIRPNLVKNARIYKVKNYTQVNSYEGIEDAFGGIHKSLIKDNDKFRDAYFDRETGQVVTVHDSNYKVFKHKEYSSLLPVKTEDGTILTDYQLGFNFALLDNIPKKSKANEYYIDTLVDAAIAIAEGHLIFDNNGFSHNVPAYNDSLSLYNVRLSSRGTNKAYDVRIVSTDYESDSITLYDIDSNTDFTVSYSEFTNDIEHFRPSVHVSEGFKEFLSNAFNYEYQKDWIFAITTPEGRIITEDELNSDLGSYIPKSSIAQEDEAPKKPSRYVSQKEAKDTNLQYFTEDYVKTQISPEMQQFIKEADGIAYELQDKINGDKRGTLTRNDVEDYLAKTDLDTMDVKTFKLINKCFYQNKVLTTPKKLKQFIGLTEKYFALGSMIAKTAGNEFILEDTDVDTALARFEHIESLPESSEYKQSYNKLLIGISYYDFDKYRPAKVVNNKFYDLKMPEIPLDLDVKSLRVNWLRSFDGSIAKGLEIANTVKHSARLAYKYKTNKSEVSLDATKSNDKGDDDTTLHDILTEDKDVENTLIKNLTGYVDSIDFEAMEYEIRDSLTETTAKLIASKYGGDLEASKGEIVRYYKLIRGLSEQQLTQVFVTKMFAKILGVPFESVFNNNTVQEQIKKYDRTSWAVNNNIKSNVRTIKTLLNRLTPKAKKYFLSDDIAEKYFNEDLSLKEDVTTIENPDLKKKGKNPRVYKPTSELMEVWNDMKLLIKNIRNDIYTNAQNYKNYLAIQDNIKKQNEDILNFYKNVKSNQNKPVKTVRQIITVPVETSYREPAKFDFIAMDTPVEIPKLLTEILSFEFTEQKKTKVKYFAQDGDTYTATNISLFLETNAEKLNTMTEADAIQILEFYTSTALAKSTMSEPQRNTYNAIREYLAYYILHQLDAGVYNIDVDLVRKFEILMTETASSAAQTLANRKVILKKLDPSATIIQSISSSMGLKPSAESLRELNKAITVGNKRNIEIAKKKMYDSMIENYKGPKHNVMDKILQWQRIMMLSAPGTWIRNALTNYAIGGFDLKIGGKVITVKGLEELSGELGNKTINAVNKLITKVFPKKHLKTYDNQYKIVGTVTSEESKNWIDKYLIKNGLLEATQEGLSKYDPRMSNSDAYSDLTSMIARSIATEIFYNNQAKNLTKSKKFNAAADWIYKYVYKKLSDDKAVTRTMLKYLGKMLTEDAERFNAKHKNVKYFDTGLDEKKVKAIAEAYRYAAMQYMHKPNFFTKLEGDMFKNSPKLVYFAYKQFFPFMAASYNWFAEGLKYNTLGLIYSCIKYAKLETTIANLELKAETGEFAMPSRFALYNAKKDIGKGIIGSIGFGIGVLLTVFGIAKLDEEEDKYTLSIGDTSVDITEIFGTQGIFLGMSVAGAMTDSHKEESDDENFASRTLDILTETFDSMFMDSSIETLYNTFRGISGGGDLIMSIPLRIIDNMLPNFLATISAITRKYDIKYSEGTLGKIQKIAYDLVPFLDRATPNLVDVYTGEKQAPFKSWFLTNLINKLTPLKIYPYNVTDMEKEAVSLGVNKGMLSGKYKVNKKEIKLTPKEIELLNTKYGELNYEYLTELKNDKIRLKVKEENGKYSTKVYSKMTDEQKKAAIEQVMSDNGTYAKIYILTSKGYKYYASSSEYNELRKLGITTNVYKKTGTKSGFYEP